MKSILLKSLKCYGLSFISGLLLVFCFPTTDLYMLAWFVLVPFLLSLYEKEPKQAFLSGVFFGTPYFFGTLYWIYHSINHYGNISFFPSISIVFILCLYLSLYTGLFALLFSITLRNTNLPSLFIAPLFWVSVEYLRSYVFTGFPWSSLGYSQYKVLTLIQLADITGIYGISFLLVAVNGALADIFLIRRRVKDMPLFPLSQTVIGFSVLVILLLLTIVYGNMRLGEQIPGEYVKISIVQGNIEQDKKWEPFFQRSVTETYVDLSHKAAASSPSMIVWPETSVPFIFKKDESFTTELLDAQRSLDTYLLFGSILYKGDQKGKTYYSNSAVLIDRTGNDVYEYDKIHLVPFGEYVPLQKVLFFINKLVVGVGDYAQGNQYSLAETPYGRFAIVICYEIIFPGLVRKFFTDEGDFLVNITNDAWFGKTTGPYQHFSMAVFRAIENRKPVIRAANTGISGFIDSKGRIISKTEIFQQVILTRDIKTNNTKSFYTKYGDLFSYLCFVLSIVILANYFGMSRRKIRR
jgi:apolipoprotein N-acyltransferase